MKPSLTPPGPFQQQSKAKSAVRLAVLGIVAVHALVFAALLSLSFVQGCKPSPTTTVGKPVETNLVDTGLPALSSNFYEPSTPLVATSRPPVIEPMRTVVAPVTPITRAPATATEYVVMKNDLFGAIAKKHSVSINALIQANPTINPDRIFPGQKIQIPPLSSSVAHPAGAPDVVTTGDSTYVVKGGDNLIKIARAHGTTVNAIKELNQRKTDRVNVGEKLMMPSATAAAPVAAPLSFEARRSPGAGATTSPSGSSAPAAANPEALPPINLPQSALPSASSGSAR